MSSSANPRWIWPLLVALLAGAVYFNALGNGFALDDIPLVRDNPQIRALGALPAHFGQPYWPVEGVEHGLYRPVTVSSFTLNRALTGAGAAGFHTVNLLLHATVCVLVWFLVRGVGRHYGTALATSALFAVHPVHTEAVANIVGRGELLAALGVLTAWLCHRRARSGPIGWSLGAVLAYGSALLAKESAILAPALFALDDRLAGSRKRWIYGGYGLALSLGIGLRALALGGLRGAENVIYLDNPAAFSSTASRIATALWVQFEQLRLFVFPLRLSSDYSFAAIPPVAQATDPRGWMGLLFVLAVCALFVAGWRRRVAPVALAAAIWLIFFLPGANLLFPSGTLLAERLAYLPSLGGCLLVGHLTAAVCTRRRWLPAAIALFSIVIVLFAVKTVSRNPDWRDNLTLTRADVATVPESAKLQAGLGIASHAAGDMATAEQTFRRAIEIYPEYAQIHFNLGQLLLNRGDADDEAIERLQRASALAPGNPSPYFSAAPVLERVGRMDEALVAYAAGSRLQPGDLGFRFNHGRLLFSLDRPSEAREVFAALARDAPESMPGRIAAAMTAGIDGQEARARELFGRLLSDSSLPDEIRRRIAVLAQGFD